ncbi:MAG TPA: methionine synthase [Thermoanaerobaculia bacterium]|jgi:5-methyltetrahydrofolate--homocysteine methyltransferase|nr:methionine synthase [Thermoanaerobaculia bacterium]
MATNAPSPRELGAAAPLDIPALPPDREARTHALLQAFDERVLVMDGATGTALQRLDLTADDFGGPELEGCNEVLNLTRPDAVDTLHETYLAAGADVVETNTFGGTALVLAEYDLADYAFDINRAAASLAREACVRHDRPGRLRFVCGSMGPTTKAISVTGGVTFEALRDHFRVQALGLMSGGTDYLLLETQQDTRNVKAGLLGIEDAFAEAGWRLPVALSVTIETSGTMLAGQDAEALAVSVAHADLLYVGLNCATGPELMRDHVRTLSELVRTRTACVPNAGLPDEDGKYHESPADFRRVLGDFVERGWLNLVGGCCGTHDGHVAALAELVQGRRPRRLPEHSRCLVSGIEAVELTADNRPLLVGERTNVLGSRKFKELVAAGEWEQAAEVGRAQVRGGGQILDVCLQDPDRDETIDVERFLDRLVRLVKVPLMIDSTDAAVMERALTYCQGKAVLNSVNLEDGLERFKKVVPLARRYGAALVVGCIDEQGMAVSAQRKLEVAQRSFRILTEDFGMRAEDLWWDPLVFPCATGDETYLGSAGATIEAVRAIKRELPDTRTILGISNVSFGLPASGREVLNSVFLYHCTQAGLDAAIVNSERLARYAEISDDERALAEALLALVPGDKAAGEAAVAAFTEHFRGRGPTAGRPPRAALPLEQRLARAVVEGSKVGLEEDLGEALRRWPEPLDIINGPLLAGMDEVGKLFNSNQLIVAEVLQSAEVMKAAVSYLEPHMEKKDGNGRGKVLLATVKGDVHDIGKNLVDIILSNNGYKVVNLGIKVPSEQLIQAAREHQPDVIGLSGLLVKSAQQMVVTAGDLAAVGVDTPLLVGGAALTRRFTHQKIAAAYNGFCTYAKDAMHGLELVDRILDGAKRPGLEAEVERLREADLLVAAEKAAACRTAEAGVSSVRRDVAPPPPPDLERHVETPALRDIWAQLNHQMLYSKYFGLKGTVRKLAEAQDAKFLMVQSVVDELKALAAGGEMEVKAAWRFFPAEAAGERLRLLHPQSGALVAEWELPRQPSGERLCLADYVVPGDHVALFVTTAGKGVRARAEAWKEAGEYLKSHGWAALALESAEAAAEWLHMKLRAAWGLADPPELTPGDRFAARYRGRRYSFGYPACPDLAGQRQLFAALAPEEIGVQLTEGDMMDPEAAVSALVFHHPDAKYFAV